MPPVNQPLAREALAPAERERIRSGMRRPAAVPLAAGSLLYRFASSYDPYRKEDTTPATRATGPWWVGAEGYALVQAQRASSLRAHGRDPTRALSLGFLARQASAVKQEWSRVDVLVTARVTADFLVFAGPGRAQHEEPDRSTGFWRYNVRFTWTGWDAITQLYLQGLDRNRPGYLAAGPKVLDILSDQRIESQQLA